MIASFILHHKIWISNKNIKQEIETEKNMTKICFVQRMVFTGYDVSNIYSSHIECHKFPLQIDKKYTSFFVILYFSCSKTLEMAWNLEIGINSWYFLMYFLVAFCYSNVSRTPILHISVFSAFFVVLFKQSFEWAKTAKIDKKSLNPKYSLSGNRKTVQICVRIHWKASLAKHHQFKQLSLLFRSVGGM